MAARAALQGPVAARAPLHVVAPGESSGERVHLNADEELMAQLAKAADGAYLREEHARRVLERLAPLSRGRVEESDTALWQSWWWFIPLVGLLTAEWILRKRAGLV